MFKEISARVRHAGLTYLTQNKLDSMEACLQSLKLQDVPGDFLEFGVALGGSAICIASELDDAVRSFIGLDVFGMIPPPSEKDGASPNERYKTIKAGKSQGIGGQKYYGYVDNLKEVVIANLTKFDLTVDGDRIRLVQGLYEDTIPTLPELQIAFCHIDCDWYDPVRLCLNYAAKRLSTGGFIILDDYNDWPGCKKATDEFMAQCPWLTMVRTLPHAVLTRPE